MVFIIKFKKGKTRIGGIEYDSNLVRIAKYMICMEYNETIFNPDGTYNVGDLKPFLLYEDEAYGNEYSVTPSSGFLMFTNLIPGYATVAAMTSEIQAIIDALGKQYPNLVESEKLIPMSYGSLHPTTQGTILYSPTTDHWIRTILVNPSDPQMDKMQGPGFIWAAYEINHVADLLITDKFSSRSEEHINRDLSTIIIDVYDYFEQPDATFQLRAMRFSDIKGYDRIIFSQIPVSQRYGLQPMLRMLCATNQTIIDNVISDVITGNCKREKIAKVYEKEYDELPTLVHVNMWTKYFVHDIQRILSDDPIVLKKLHSSYDSDSDDSSKPLKKPAKKTAKKTKKPVKKPAKKSKAVFSDEDSDGEGKADDGNDVEADEADDGNDVEADEPEVDEPEVVETVTVEPTVGLTDKQQYLLKMDVNLKEKRNDVCVLCLVPLHSTVMILQHVVTKKCTAVCELCFTEFLSFTDTILDEPHCVVWKVTYPRTMYKVLYDSDVILATKIYEDTYDKDMLLAGLRMIACASERIIYQRYTSEEEKHHPRYRYSKMGILPSLHEDSERWQFMFTGSYKGDKGDKKPFNLYMINDQAFCMSDYDLLRNQNNYIVLGGLLGKP